MGVFLHFYFMMLWFFFVFFFFNFYCMVLRIFFSLIFFSLVISFSFFFSVFGKDLACFLLYQGRWSDMDLAYSSWFGVLENLSPVLAAFYD